MKNLLFIFLLYLVISSCQNKTKASQNKTTEKIVSIQKPPFLWNAANIYFLLTDRFNNGDTSNDVNFNRTEETAVLRGFEGGDIKGITKKVKEGYFTNLGINAIWMTPIVEQIHGATNEGTGNTYGFHGYWTKDWTAIDPNYGNKEDLHELIEVAHTRGIRILLDAVINHTGPVTDKDPVWPSDWVRTSPKCQHNTYQSTVTCTLVENLPDIKTESNQPVALPPQLIQKWKSEGRYEQEVEELDAFFKRTGYPRAPRFYIMKWLTDYITEFGIDGYRCDTVKHTEPYVWEEFKTECDYAFSEFKKNHPDKVLDDTDFYLVGEVYNYGISAGKAFDFGDKKVNYFDNKFSSQINFEFKWNAQQMPIDDLFSKYNKILNSDLKGFGILNYMSSHDDGKPFDALRENPFETATKLLLAPGASQIYYGDELARVLEVEDAEGDANLRSFMTWATVNSKKDILTHWQKLGQFRAKHPAVGVGKHKVLLKSPYVFARSYMHNNFTDLIIIGLGLPKGKKLVEVSGVFKENQTVRDAYSGEIAHVIQGEVIIHSEFDIVLLEQIHNKHKTY